MQNIIEKKYQNIIEKDILNKLTYAECLFILTPENKYCDEIKRLSLLKICEIFEKLQKENEDLKAKLEYKQYGDLDNIEFEKYINDIVETRTKELKEQLKEEQELNKIIKETRINKRSDDLS